MVELHVEMHVTVLMCYCSQNGDMSTDFIVVRLVVFEIN
jgi:hypothetical protein